MITKNTNIICEKFITTPRIGAPSEIDIFSKRPSTYVTLSLGYQDVTTKHPNYNIYQKFT